MIHYHKMFFIPGVVFLLMLCGTLVAQDPLRFKDEVDAIVENNKSAQQSNVILFTGSSSVRLWKGLQSSFPKHNILNTGFGGSEMSDLLYYADKLIIPYNPEQVFIYEGDNDINAGRSIEQILLSADSIVLLVRNVLPESEIIFISPKPSLRRWELRAQYEAFNKALKAWTATQKNVKYMDVWTPMLDASGNVKKDIFIKDELHLNEKGYAIWANTVRKYIRRKSN